MHEERVGRILDQPCDRLFRRERGPIAVSRWPLPPNLATSKSLRPPLSRALAHASDKVGLQSRLSIWSAGLVPVCRPIAPGFGQAMATRRANPTAAAPRFTFMASSLRWTFPGAETHEHLPTNRMPRHFVAHSIRLGDHASGRPDTVDLVFPAGCQIQAAGTLRAFRDRFLTDRSREAVPHGLAPRIRGSWDGSSSRS
jgi:hypothetical protein